MDVMIEQVSGLDIFNQFWLAVFLVIPMILIARTVVAGTRYSPILIIVIFGLTMGYILVQTGVSQPGLTEFPLIELISKTTIIALTVSFFVGGQELRKIFGNIQSDTDKSVIYSTEEIVMGTVRTHLFFILRAFFILIGIEALSRLLLDNSVSALSNQYLIIAYIGLVASIILIDYKATLADKPTYIKKGLLEMLFIFIIMVLSFAISDYVRQFIALPQIFFAMIIASSLGAIFYKWNYGPTIRSLLFAGIPVVLAGNFMIGGSRILDAFTISGMNSVLIYGFFGQLFWMFGGMAILIFIGRTSNIRNLAPGMAGGLSHSGLTGACTAGDFGDTAARRAPIMINIPFFGHLFVFSVLAVSADMGELWLIPSIIIVLVGFLFMYFALRNIRKSVGNDSIEVKGLMQFSFGWQLIALFAGLTALSIASMSIEYSAMATSSALSHFGLFAAIQGEMFGAEAAILIPFIFAMPFLVHPIVFFMFGKAMQNQGEMPKYAALAFAVIGLLGLIIGLIV